MDLERAADPGLWQHMIGYDRLDDVQELGQYVYNLRHMSLPLLGFLSL